MINEQEILQSLYFFLPGMLANGTPPIVAKIPGLKNWNTPVDLGKGFLGSHKTIRGIIFGLLVALLVGWGQFSLFGNPWGRSISVFEYSNLGSSLFLSLILGFGALGGDLVKSFLKRKKGIAPGEVWFWPDKMDYGVGAILASSLYFFPGVKMIVIFLIVAPLLSIISTIIGKLLGVRDVWI